MVHFISVVYYNPRSYMRENDGKCVKWRDCV